MTISPKVKRWLGVSAAVAAVLGIGLGWSGRQWFSGRVDSVTAMPPRDAAPLGAMSPQRSTIAANILIPYGAITDAVKSSVSGTLQVNDDPKFCIDVQEQIARTVRTRTGLDNLFRWILKKVFVWTNVRYCDRLKVTGTITVRKEGVLTAPIGERVMRITIPVAVDGKVGLRGDIARVAKLNEKNVRGAINAFVDIGLDLDERWCPQVTLKPGFTWVENAKLEVVERAWLDVSEQVEKNLKEELTKLEQSVQGKIDCNAVRAGVAEQWATHRSFVRSQSKEGFAEAEIVFTPDGAGVHGITMSPQGARLALSLDGTVTVAAVDQPLEDADAGSTASASAGGPKLGVVELPPLKKLSTVTENKTRLAVVARAPYALVSRQLSDALQNRRFEGETPVGRAYAAVSAVEVYPSGGKLAIRVGVEAGLQRWWRLMSFKGDIYLVGAPQVRENDQVLTIQEPSFHAAVDNVMFQALAVLLKKPIDEAVARFSLDLKPQLADAAHNLNYLVASQNDASQAMAGKKHATYFLTVDVSSAEVRIGRIGTGPQALEVEGLAAARISLALTEVDEKAQPVEPVPGTGFIRLAKSFGAAPSTDPSLAPAPVTPKRREPRLPSGDRISIW